MEVLEVGSRRAVGWPDVGRTRALATAVAGLSVGAAMVGLVVDEVAKRRPSDGASTEVNLMLPVPTAVAFSACAAFLWGFQAARPVGKVMLVVGALTGFGVLTSGLQVLWAAPGTTTGELGSAISTLGLVLSLVLLPQVFPSGLLPGRVWILIAWSSTVVALGSIVAVVAVSVVADDPDWPWAAMGFAVTCGAVAGVASLAIRWRSADKVVRSQIFGFALVSLLAVVVVAFGSMPGERDLHTDSVTMWWPVAAVVAVTFAAVRHDLYGIRTSVRRIAVFTATVVALSVASATVYLAVIDLMEGPSRGAPLHWPAVVAAAGAILLLDTLRRHLTGAVERRLLGQRSGVISALADLGHTPSQDVLVALVDTVAIAVRSPGVRLSAHDAGDSRIVAEAGDAALASVVIPLEFEAELMGELDVAPRTPGEPFQDGDRELLRLLALQAAIQLYLARRVADLARAREESSEHDQQMRAQIGRDLHDGLAPLLAGAGLTADALRLGMHPGSIDARDAARLSDQLRAATAQVRRLARDLQPVVLSAGLASAIQTFVAGLDGPGTPLIESTVEIGEMPVALVEAAYFIVLEAIHNAIRHGHPSHVWVCVRQLGTALEVRVSDDGTGISQPYESGLGLGSMRRRAAAVGGHLQLSPRPGGGADLSVTMRSGL